MTAIDLSNLPANDRDLRTSRREKLYRVIGRCDPWFKVLGWPGSHRSGGLRRGMIRVVRSGKSGGWPWFRCWRLPGFWPCGQVWRRWCKPSLGPFRARRKYGNRSMSCAPTLQPRPRRNVLSTSGKAQRTRSWLPLARHLRSRTAAAAHCWSIRTIIPTADSDGRCPGSAGY